MEKLTTMEGETKDENSYWRRTSSEPMDPALERIFINEDNLRANEAYDATKTNSSKAKIITKKKNH